MSTHNKTDDLEPYEDAVRRHRNQLRGTLKKKSALAKVARFMAGVEVQRGQVAPPIR